MSKIISALAIATLLSLPASAAVSRSLATNASANCPTLEGYPDCHPDGSSAWSAYREYARGRSR
jgi:hypothetical protein